MNGLEQILLKLPQEISARMSSLPCSIIDHLEEIRIRSGQNILLFANGTEYEVEGPNGEKITYELLNTIFQSLLNHSIYAYQEELSNGYITIEGGHRVGICGHTVMENGRVKTIKNISSINIRRSQEFIGISDPCMRYLIKGNRNVYNCLIISPPKCGKTTLLRDLIRNLSGMGFQIGVCDERSEISGSFHGQTTYNLGFRTDVLDGCPKEQGMIMLIRSMAPDIIATDEIGKKEDCYAIEAAVCAGINLITTIHGNCYDDLLNSGIGNMVRNGVFERLIFLSNTPAIGSVSTIRDGRNHVVR